jgi:hypothetical protein
MEIMVFLWAAFELSTAFTIWIKRRPCDDAGLEASHGTSSIAGLADYFDDQDVP